MRYIPMREEGNRNRWTTELCSINGGLHDQTQFKSAVEMLEEAVDTWTAPRLIHITLTWATVDGYAEFIDRMKRHMPVKAYKAAIETDTRKGQHVHWMLIVDASSPDNLFDLDDDSSAVNKVMKRIQRTEPEFNVTIGQPYKYRDTLHDAVDYFSYALKARSKPVVGAGGCYWSSRSKPARQSCPGHRHPQPVKQNHLFDGDF